MLMIVTEDDMNKDEFSNDQNDEGDATVPVLMPP